jgi:transcriptional regulator with XRE-family HTH domain
MLLAMSESPTARRRRLGQVLRELRDRSGLTIEQAAKAAGVSGPHLSRIERARVGVRLPAVKLLLQTYQADAETVEELTDIASTSGERGWWHDFGITRPYQTLISFESAATALRNYEPLIVPGLLQTGDYARGLLQRGPARLAADTISERAEVRRQRQSILDQAQQQVFSFVLDEAVIRRPVGGPAVMGQQLRHILEVAARPNVDVQVIPFAVGAHPGLLGSFVVLSFAPGERDVIYTEGIGGDLYPERQIEWYGDVFHRLQSVALSPDDSAQLVQQATEEWDR